MYYLDLHTHNFQKNDQTVIVRNFYPNSNLEDFDYFSMGIHPWYIDLNTHEFEIKLIEKQLSNPYCIAVGECGLDRTIKTDFLLQKKVFLKQTILAEKYKKPIILHSVKAYQEITEILKKEKITVPIIFHGFSKNSHIHSLLLKFPTIYFSYGKSMLTSKVTQANILATPIDRLFVETDNAQVEISLLYYKVAEIKKITVETLQKQVLLNFQKIFKVDLIDDNG
ncbi:MAG: TatD family hydrolase [Bacteroidetes bacterium]|jgi:TatD DNase family protein|nr:TatD family hydrolase [Bacteroidota bacterium]